MSLREMHEQQKQSSPREQLQELNRQSRTELENSLLKEALAMSSENCEELMKQSNQEQVRAEHTKAWKGHEVLIATHIDKGHLCPLRTLLGLKCPRPYHTQSISILSRLWLS